MPISSPPTTPPTAPTSSDAATFRSRSDAFVAWIVTFVTWLISFVTQANALEENVNAKEASATASADIAVGAANYQGDWVAGSYSKGQSVSKDGLRYLSKINLNSDTPPSANWLNIGTAASTSFNNTASGLTATHVEGAINEAVSMIPAPVPAGTITYFASSTPPIGYIKANGAAVSRTAYAALFTAIGTTFGVGDGATTFNIPDLRGEFIRSWDDGMGIDVNRVFGSWQVDDFKSHTHSLPYGPNAGGGSYALNNVYNAIPLSGYTGATQTSGGVETRPRNIALLACIKY